MLERYDATPSAVEGRTVPLITQHARTHQGMLRVPLERLAQLGRGAFFALALDRRYARSFHL